MKVQSFQSQNGFLSAFVIIFVVTLGLLAVGSAVLIRSESTNIGNQVAMVNAENAARGAVHYARKFIAVNGDSIDMPVLTIGGATVSMYQVQGSSQIDLYMTVRSGPVENNMHIVMTGSGSMNYAIYASGSVTDQDTEDSTGTEDNTLIYQNAPTFPYVQELNLDSIAVMLRTFDGIIRKNSDASYSPLNNFPDGAFYDASGLPNVTIVGGNLNVAAGRTIYGIYVVYGTVTLAGSLLSNGGRVDGVVYLATPNQTCTLGRRSRLRGAIYSKGSVAGTRYILGDSKVRHVPDWVRAFLNYVDVEEAETVPSVVSWDYY